MVDPGLDGPLPQLLSAGPDFTVDSSPYDFFPHFLTPSPPPPPPPHATRRVVDANQRLPILLPTPSPSRPLTTSFIPPGCFQEFVLPPRYKNKRPGSKTQSGKWGGPIGFAPFLVPYKGALGNKGVLGTPLRDCLDGFGLKDPEERIFGSLASAGKSYIQFMIMVSVGDSMGLS